MTINSALRHALSGLHVAGRATDVLAQNISNATTPGYARRLLEVSSVATNNIGGATVKGIVRDVDPVLIAGRRTAESEMAAANAINSFSTRLESTYGTPDNPMALTNLVADFDAQLLSAASRPDSSERQFATLSAAKSLMSSISSASTEISAMRTEADNSINVQVGRLNAALSEVEDLNIRITQLNSRNTDVSALMDLRQTAIDEINTIVPVREAPRDHGGVALYSTGGIVLLDYSAQLVEFTPSNQVTPYMTQSGGHLSGLTVAGNPISTAGSNYGLPGGTLAAQFEIRDQRGEEAQSQIDAVARDLVERFQDPTVDPTLLVGDAGLFTDMGAAFDPLNETGLAERLQINAAVDPDQGGEVWRLRDGINAATPGSVGQSAILDTLRDALTGRRPPSSGNFGTGSLTLSGLTNSLVSQVGVQRLGSEQKLSFASASFFEMTQAEQAAGVDTDVELQNLMLVEQAYAANARMMTVIDEMMDTILRIG